MDLPPDITLVPFGPDANCTLDTCPLEWSVLTYRPYVPASWTFIGMFSLAAIIHAIEGIRWRSWWFLSCMLAGCICQIVGYVGRLMLYDNPFSFEGLLIQIICITVAPVFFCAGIYVTLSQIIHYIDALKSRINPKLYYWVFLPCDIISLVLQAVGGAISCVSTSKVTVQQGVDVSLAGLVFQVVTMLVFCFLFADYLRTCWRSRETRSTLTTRVKLFLGFLFLSITLILLRCVYRIVELHEGYFSHWFQDQDLFIALESGVMSIAVLCLTIGHPGLVFGRKVEVVMESKESVKEPSRGASCDEVVRGEGTKKPQV